MIGRRPMWLPLAALVSAAMSGCIVTPLFQRRLQQTQTEADVLETRVGYLEASRGMTSYTGPTPSTPTPFPPLPSATVPEAGLDATVVSGIGGIEPAAQPASRWPRTSFNTRKALGKLIRGLTNVVTGWVEVPKRVDETAQRSGPGAGFSWGLVRGVGYGFVRTAGGVYEVVTFPAPVPRDYQPIMRPVYVFRCEEVAITP